MGRSREGAPLVSNRDAVTDRPIIRLNIIDGKVWKTLSQVNLAPLPAATDPALRPRNALESQFAVVAGLIKALPVRASGLMGLERAISSAGGLSWAALDENLMLHQGAMASTDRSGRFKPLGVGWLEIM